MHANSILWQHHRLTCSVQLRDLLVERGQSLFQGCSVAGIFCRVELLENAAAGKMQSFLAAFNFSLFGSQVPLGLACGPCILLL